MVKTYSFENVCSGNSFGQQSFLNVLYTMECEISKGRINEPNMCPNCKQSKTMQIIHNRSLYTTRQLWKVQESPDDMPPGQTPHSVTMQCFDSLVDGAQPGDRVTITGIYRAQQVRHAPRARSVKTVCRTFVDVVHCMKATKGKLHEKRREAQDDHLVSTTAHYFNSEMFFSSHFNYLFRLLTPDKFYRTTE